MALPSDVRWRLCPTGTGYYEYGAAPRGIAPKFKSRKGRSETFRTSGGRAAHSLHCAGLRLDTFDLSDLSNLVTYLQAVLENLLL
jgi:hypothetical protein